MTERLKYGTVAPGVMQAMRALTTYINSTGLEHSLLELVKVRASQINRCAYCVDMHWKDARAAGETEQRLYSLTAWRETTFYTDRERAALAWTETLTLLAQNKVSDELYAEALKHFSEKELVDLTLAIVQINGWNRFVISFRTPPGSYRVPSSEFRVPSDAPKEHVQST